jgi:hypothetical protein
VYSLVGPAELAAALVRHPGGGAVADVLDRALRTGRTDLSRLSAAFRDDAARRTSWAEVASLAGATAATAGARVGTADLSAADGPAEPSVHAGAAPSSVTADGAPVVLADLLDLLREEVLGWTREQHGDLIVQTEADGATAVADALGAAWAAGDISAGARERLRTPWLTVYGSIPVVADAGGFGPHSAAVRRVVDTIATASPDTLIQLGEAYRVQAPPRPSGVRPWDVAMRRACQAAFVTGRVREVAAAQFAAVRAQLLAGGAASLPGTPAGVSVAFAVAGTVQAAAMQETLDPVVYRFLVFAWEATFGSAPS